MAVPFLLVPCVAAVMAAYFLRDWRLAAAAASGGLALLFLLSGRGIPLAAFVLPVAGGIAAGGLALAPFLAIRPGMSVWSRMTIALAAALVAHYALLLATVEPG